MPSTNIHSGSHPDTGYTTPNDVSGLLTPDLDLPIDFGAFDDFPVTETFTSHPPSVATPHTHHYTPQPPHQSQQLQQHHLPHVPPIQPSHNHGNVQS